MINKSGAWYAYNGEKIGQGRENAKSYLRENPVIRDEVEAKVRAHYDTEAEEETAAESTEKKTAEKKGAEKKEIADVPAEK